jgi:hypothetical protein
MSDTYTALLHLLDILGHDFPEPKRRAVEDWLQEIIDDAHTDGFDAGCIHMEAGSGN